MKRLQCSQEIGGLNGNHYNMAMQGSCSIISLFSDLFQALGFFLYRKLLVAQPLFFDREPETDYSIIQDVALFRK